MTANLRFGLMAIALALMAFVVSNRIAYFSWINLSAALTSLGAAIAAGTVRDRTFRIEERIARYAFALAAFVPMAVSAIYWFLEMPSLAFVAALSGILLAIGFVRRPAALPLGIDFGLGLVALAVTGAAVQTCVIFYGQYDPPQYAMRWAAFAGFLTLAIALLIGPFGVRSRFGWALVGLLFLSGAAVRVLPLYASPDPLIDVFTWIRDAADYQWSGQNPYAQDYESPYSSDRVWEYGVCQEPEARPAAYPPQPFLAAMPFRLWNGDMRWPNVLGDLLAATMLFLVAIRRGSLTYGMTLAGLYLHLSRVELIMEQAWYEPMLAGGLGLGLWCRDRGWRIGHFFLGIALTAKQFGVVMVLPLLAAFRHQRIGLILGILIALVVFLLPWYLWSPQDFLEVVVWKHFRRPVQLHSLTITSALFNLGLTEVPRWLMWIPVFGLIGWVCRRTPSAPSASAWGMGTALLIFCLFHTQGYVNYFYLVQYLWLLGLAGANGLVNPTHSAR